MKKKVIAILLVIALVMPVLNVSASAKYDGEILFRDIPWGSTFAETLKSLKEDGINVDSYECFPAFIRFKGDVAGYESIDINLYFLDPSGKDVSFAPGFGSGLSLYDFVTGSAPETYMDEILQREDEIVLYKAEYHKHHLYKNVIDEMLSKMQMKLTYLYGEHDTYDGYNEKKKIEKKYFWQGSNNTEIELSEVCYLDPVNHNDECHVYIRYEAKDFYKEWEKKNKKIREEERKRKEEEAEEQKRKEREEFIKDALSNFEGL